jgi:extracellular matrix regulatory protein A
VLLDIVSIGHNNYIPKSKISGFYQINSRPIRTLISTARIKEKLIDATNGKKSKTVIILSDDFIIISSIAPKTLAERFVGGESF